MPSFLDKLKPDVFKVKAIIVGSPTFNQGVLPTISLIFEDLEGLKFQNKIGAAFCFYKRSVQSVNIIKQATTDTVTKNKQHTTRLVFISLFPQ